MPFTLSLPAGTNRITAWALDERGQRKKQPSRSPAVNRPPPWMVTNTGSIWYELEVARWITSFELWQQHYFSVEELANTNVSGATATPDGDRVPNLLKYYMGLPGRTNAPANGLTTGGLFPSNSDFYLSMTYTRDKLANDVKSIPQGVHEFRQMVFWTFLHPGGTDYGPRYLSWSRSLSAT